MKLQEEHIQLFMSFIPEKQTAISLQNHTVPQDYPQQCLDLFEQQDTFTFCSFDTQQDFPCLLGSEGKNTFVVLSQGCNILNTQEKLIDYLDTFMHSIKSGPAMMEFRSQLAFYRYRPDSFLYLLAENCNLLLEESRVGQLLVNSTIYTAIMMIDLERYELSANERKVNTRKLLQQ